MTCPHAIVIVAGAVAPMIFLAVLGECLTGSFFAVEFPSRISLLEVGDVLFLGGLFRSKSSGVIRGTSGGFLCFLRGLPVSIVQEDSIEQDPHQSR